MIDKTKGYGWISDLPIFKPKVGDIVYSVRQDISYDFEDGPVHLIDPMPCATKRTVVYIHKDGILTTYECEFLGLKHEWHDSDRESFRKWESLT